MDVETSSARTHRSPVLAVVVLTALLAVACGGKSSSSDSSGETKTVSTSNAVVTVAPPGPPQAGGTLNFGLLAETDGWDPFNSRWASSGATVSYAVFDRLAMNDADEKPNPYLAESITPNSDFTAWTIKLRSGVSFHNGEKLDADALKQNLDAARKSVLLGPAADFITAADVVDPLTVKVTMKKPWSTYMSALTTQAGVVVAPAMLKDPNGSRNPIGTGPFVFKQWTPDKDLTVAKNPNYWRQGEPLLDGVTFKVITDNTARSASLTAGDIEAMETTDPNQIIKLLDQANAGQIQLYTNQYSNDVPLQYVALNTSKPPFDDPLARQVVAYGLDRKNLADTLYMGLFPVANSLFPSNSTLYAADSGYPNFDQVKAKQLADEYQQKYGKPLSFSVNIPALPEYKAIAESTQAQAREFGVDIQINSMEQAKLIVDALTGNYEATGFVTFGDPDTDRIFIASDTIQPPGALSLNFTRNDNPTLTKALDAVRATSDFEQQKAQWKIVQQEMAKDLSMIFLVHQRSAVAFTNKIIGVASATFPDGSPLALTTSPVLTATWKS